MSSIGNQLEASMTKGEILAHYKELSPEEKHGFNRWLVGNAVAGVVFTGALLLFAGAGWWGEDTASQPTKLITNTASFQELHALAHQEYLPVLQFDDLTLVFTPLDTDAHSAVLAQGEKAKR
jgi:hypothetical protein